jgi:hypothetical protein
VLRPHGGLNLGKLACCSASPSRSWLAHLSADNLLPWAYPSVDCRPGFVDCIRLRVKLPCNLTSYYCIKDKALAILVIACVIGSMRLGGAWHLAGHHPSPRCSRGRTPQSAGPPSLLNITYSHVCDSYRGAQRSN